MVDYTTYKKLLRAQKPEGVFCLFSFNDIQYVIVLYDICSIAFFNGNEFEIIVSNSTLSVVIRYGDIFTQTNIQNLAALIEVIEEVTSNNQKWNPDKY